MKQSKSRPKDLFNLISSIEARKRKGIPEPNPQTVSLFLSTRQISKINQLFYQAICNACPDKANAYVSSRPVSVTISGPQVPFDNCIYACVCAVQYYRIPENGGKAIK